MTHAAEGSFAPDLVRYCALCLTHRCNLRCSYCYSDPAPGRLMSEETAGHHLTYLPKYVLSTDEELRRPES